MTLFLIKYSKQVTRHQKEHTVDILKINFPRKKLDNSLTMTLAYLMIETVKEAI